MVIIPIKRRLCFEIGGFNVNREQLFYNLMNTVSPVTQRVLEDWIASLSTFADVLNRYPPLVANDVLMELEFYSVIVWKDGIPRLVFLKQ